MNQREPTSVPQCTGPASPCLALLLVTLLSGARALAHPQPVIQAPALPAERPYLVALGAPPLRFQDPPPPAELVHRPSKPGELSPPSSGSTPSLSEALAQPVPEVSSEMDAPLNDRGSSASLDADSSPSVPMRIPRPILPDEMRPQARAEDFLPFFEIPVTQSGDVTLVVPVPRAPGAAPALPASSATYRQTAR